MASIVLSFKNINSTPFSAFIKKVISKGLRELIDSNDIELDYSGKKDSSYIIDFTTLKLPKAKCWYDKAIFGSNFSVYVNAIQLKNYCEDISDCKTCEKVFRNKENELGGAIANTAMHEIGHMFGLTKKSSYAGADDAGHTGNERNFMLDYPVHKDYEVYTKDYKRTKTYKIREGDTLFDIAERIGFIRPDNTWKDLYAFKGKDGKANREKLRSKDSSRIYQGEEIWVPDIKARIDFYRKIEGVPKEFTKVQIQKMRSVIRASDVPRSFINFE